MENKTLTAPKARAFISDPDAQYIRHDIESNPQAFVIEKLTTRYNFGSDEIMRHGQYKEMGFIYDLRPYLRHFVYKQYGSWQECYALNRGNLRKLVHGRIDKILED